MVEKIVKVSAGGVCNLRYLFVFFVTHLLQPGRSYESGIGYKIEP